MVFPVMDNQQLNHLMATINLFGASGHANVIKDIIEAEGNSVGCLYDDAHHCENIHGVQVYKASDCDVEGPLIISIGSNRVREIIANRYPVAYATAIHPSAIVSKYATVGAGTVVMQGVIIQSDAKIGKHCIVNTGASIDHECELGDYVHISPHTTLCGNVRVGKGSWIGAGATVIPGVKIGEWCTVGAGAVVLHDINDNSVVAGIPAKPLK